MTIKGVAIKNTSLWAFIAFVYLVSIPLTIWIGRQDNFEIWNALAIGFACGAIIRWAPSGVRALMPPIHELKSADFLVVGIGMIAIGGGARFGGQWVWRAFNKPEWVIDSVFFLYSTITMAIGFLLLFLPTFSENGGIMQHRAGMKTSTVAIISLAIGTGLLWFGWGR